VINSRAKGQRGERELFALLSDYLGIICKRNVDQAREGGADGIDIPGWAMEVKFCEREELKDWWGQTCQQASVLRRKPMLWYRASRKPWRAVVDLHTLRPDMFPVEYRESAIIGLDAACQLIRETLVTDKIPNGALWESAVQMFDR
jgi:hypothetical protein